MPVKKSTRPRRQRIEQEYIKPDASLVFDYKNPELLKRYVTESGSIIARQRNGLTAKQQRQLAQQIKRARQIALLPFTSTL